MKRPDDLERRYRQGAETAPLKSKFTTPLDRSSVAEQEGLEIDDKKNIVNLTKTLRRLLENPGRYPFTEVLDNVNAYLANMAESWSAIRTEMLGEDMINDELEEHTNPEELGKLFENAMSQLLTEKMKEVPKWQTGDRNAIKHIDTLFTSYTLLGDEASERVNRFIKKLYDAGRRYQ